MRDDAVAAFFWVANWVFVFRDTDYFTQGETPSPLQHTWSLAVEEQYYVVWPLVLVAVAVLLAGSPGTAPPADTAHGPVGRVRASLRPVRWPRRSRRAFMVSDASLNRVYFGTDTRVQALLVGAAASALLVRDWSSLARYGTQIRSRWGRWIAQLLPVIGLAMLGVVGALRDGQCAGIPRVDC